MVFEFWNGIKRLRLKGRWGLGFGINEVDDKEDGVWGLGFGL